MQHRQLKQSTELKRQSRVSDIAVAYNTNPLIFCRFLLTLPFNPRQIPVQCFHIFQQNAENASLREIPSRPQKKETVQSPFNFLNPTLSWRQLPSQRLRRQLFQRQREPYRQRLWH